MQSIFGGPVKKVLIVDDDVLLIETLANILTSHGYQVDSAENGKVAFRSYLIIQMSLIYLSQTLICRL